MISWPPKPESDRSPWTMIEITCRAGFGQRSSSLLYKICIHVNQGPACLVPERHCPSASAASLLQHNWIKGLNYLLGIVIIHPFDLGVLKQRDIKMLQDNGTRRLRSKPSCCSSCSMFKVLILLEGELRPPHQVFHNTLFLDCPVFCSIHLLINSLLKKSIPKHYASTTLLHGGKVILKRCFACMPKSSAPLSFCVSFMICGRLRGTLFWCFLLTITYFSPFSHKSHICRLQTK